MAGEVASLTNRALDGILEFAGEAGLLVMIHDDIDTPVPGPNQEPWTVLQLKDLFTRHPKTKIIWSHIGAGRIVRPLNEQAELIERALTDPELSHLYFDISCDEVAKYAVATPEDTERVAGVINRFPDRFLFGTDVVAPATVDTLTRVFRTFDPLWTRLSPAASHQVRLGNYERLFDQARRDVRAWESKHLKRRKADRRRDVLAPAMARAGVHAPAGTA